MGKQQDTEGKIKILPDFVANQIAAGEVVQRPESVVKELVENSLDSGADTIAVIVKDAGKKLIHVVDNGEGISRHDLSLITKRHATSKIFTAEDLQKIMTYGFRGEAVASISSVALLEIRTKRADDSVGWKLIAEPTKPDKIEPGSSDNGTQVFVRNLFYNVPARRKFLKSNLTEFRHISETMTKFAISNPDKRFTFYDDNTLIFDLQPTTPEKRVFEALGPKAQDSMMEVNYESELVKITGYIGQPRLARKSRTGQYLFLNNRSIQNRYINHAVFTAYEHLIEKDKYPIYVINLNIDPEKVDINVHPQKHEVKFDDEQYIYNTVQRAVAETLNKHNLIPETDLFEQDAGMPFDKVGGGKKDDDFIMVNRNTGEVVDREPQRHEPDKAPAQSGGGFPGQQDWEKHAQDKPSSEELSAFEAIFGSEKKRSELSPEQPASDAGQTPGHESRSEEEQLPESMFWQLHNKYVFVRTEKGMLIIDQNAAHQRILYEKALKALDGKAENFQELLFPVRIELNSVGRSFLKEYEKEINDLGFRFRFADDDNIELTAVPADLKSGQEHRVFNDMLEDLEEHSNQKKPDVRDKLAATLSMKAAIPAGEKLSAAEMSSLYNELTKCNYPQVTRQGRKTFISTSLEKLDSRFSG